MSGTAIASSKVMLGTLGALLRWLFAGARCPACRVDIRPLALLCEGCEGAIEMDEEGAAFLYGGPVADIVRAWKYRGQAELTRVVAELMFASVAFLELERGRFDVVVSVPLHPRKLRRRGYHTVSLLAARVASRLARNHPIRAERLLRRTRDDPAQANLGREERTLNVHESFAVRKAARVRGRRILLLDDVRTTDATLREAERVLRAAGAKEVCSFAFARSGKNSMSPVLLGGVR